MSETQTNQGRTVRWLVRSIVGPIQCASLHVVEVRFRYRVPAHALSTVLDCGGIHVQTTVQHLEEYLNRVHSRIASHQQILVHQVEFMSHDKFLTDTGCALTGAAMI